MYGIIYFLRLLWLWDLLENDFLPMGNLMVPIYLGVFMWVVALVKISSWKNFSSETRLFEVLWSSLFLWTQIVYQLHLLAVAAKCFVLLCMYCRLCRCIRMSEFRFEILFHWKWARIFLGHALKSLLFS